MPEWKLEVIHSFEEAARRDREEMWAMTPNERMALLEELRRSWYGDSYTAAEFPGKLEVVQLSDL